MTDKTLDLTPTWSALLPVLLDAYEQTDNDNRWMILAELKKMALAADRYNELVKNGKTTVPV